MLNSVHDHSKLNLIAQKIQCGNFSWPLPSLVINLDRFPLNNLKLLNCTEVIAWSKTPFFKLDQNILLLSANSSANFSSPNKIFLSPEKITPESKFYPQFNKFNFFHCPALANLTIIHGELNPAELQLAANLGCDLIISDAPYLQAEKGICYLANDLECDLNSTEFVFDTSAINSDCECYTCQNYSRSYLHHLQITKQLHAAVLISIHNLFYCNQLIVAARS